MQKELARVGGLSVLIYDQTCAAEKRRRRKRGKHADPDVRVVINELVCEGCGDCGVQSNCVAIVPVETEFGRKRAIDQSSCNKDFSCLKGFCPSFVTVHGAKRHQRSTEADFAAAGGHAAGDDESYAMLITGVGGTGVVTIGAILAMAAHLEGKGVGVIDMAGLAQKGGPVTSHVRIAPTPGSVKAIRVAAGGADAILACDMVVAGTAQVACRDPPQPHPRLRQHPRDLSGRVHPRPRHDAADAAADCGDHRPGRRGADAHDRGDGDRHRAPRRRDRHQHVHARPGVAVGGDPALVCRDRAGDRAERRRRRDEQGGLRLGPPRRGRAGRGGADRGAPHRAGAAGDRDGRRAGRAAGRLPRRVPERGLCAPLQRAVQRIRAAEHAVAPGRDNLAHAVA